MKTQDTMTKVLLLGKDGRTDCIAEALLSGGARLYILSDFESPGLQQKAERFQIGKCDDIQAVLQFAKEIQPDLVVIGPEEPLAAGVVDEIKSKLDVPCFGPTQKLAQLESSKSFTRALLTNAGISGNVEYRTFHDESGLIQYAEKLGKFVIKPDGLTGGKGVQVMGDHFHTMEAGIGYATSLLRAGKGPVVIEELLEGEEFSLQSLCDGETIVDMVPVQDHKRARVGDKGPNTGGMGTYSCENHLLPFLAPQHLAQASKINAAVARALMNTTGQAYRGVLYGGFMVTAKGVHLVEYNVRFGDPEAMNVIPLMEGNFLDLCLAVACGRLRDFEVRFKQLATVCKYLVPSGYPDKPVRDVPITFRHQFEPTNQLRMYYAAVRQVEGEVRLTGSRALAFVGFADTVPSASVIVEEAIREVEGPLFHREDIGTPELLAKRVVHMDRLRSQSMPPAWEESRAPL
jgi:phosphoribosylamine--glycine ligase